jgi:hypothetical protein
MSGGIIRNNLRIDQFADVRIVVTSYYLSIEITFADPHIKYSHIMNVLELFSKITTFVFDVDGVLTDGTVLVLPNGVQARQMHIKDGFGLQMATRNGFK